mgnify:CR=1 FL=1
MYINVKYNSIYIPWLFDCINLPGDGVLVRPQYDSGWFDIESDSDSTDDNATLHLLHGLGEEPLLVDVQVKAIDGPNIGYIFPAVGKCWDQSRNVK